MNGTSPGLDKTPAYGTPRPIEVDLDLCRQEGEYHVLPPELQFKLRPGTTVQTKLGELFVTGAGLRCKARVMADIRSGVIPLPLKKSEDPAILAASLAFNRRLNGNSWPSQDKFPTTRRGSRHQ